MSIDEKALHKALLVWENEAAEAMSKDEFLGAEREARIVIEAYEAAKGEEQPDDSWLIKQMLVACEGLEDLEDCMVSALAVVKLYTRQPKRESGERTPWADEVRAFMHYPIPNITEIEGESQ